MIGNQKDNERTVVLSTKIRASVAERLNVICKTMGVDIYHLLQWFVYTLDRASHEEHHLSPDIQKLMTLLECDAGWQKAFNIANPDKLKVAQVILILEQEGHKGFGAVKVDRPWMGDSRVSFSTDDIMELVTEVTMRGIYNRLRNVGAKMKCERLSDIILSICDAQDVLLCEQEDAAELPGLGDVADNGRRHVFGERTKAKKHLTPDSIQTHIVFDEYDKTTTDMPQEAWEGEHRGDLGDEVVEGLGCKPFTDEP